VLQNNFKFGRVCKDFQNIILFKIRFVLERAKPYLTEPRNSSRFSVFIYELNLLYHLHFNVIMAEDHKENIFNYFLKMYIILYDSYLKLCCASPHSTKYIHI
jgi:hypothetical protein